MKIANDSMISGPVDLSAPWQSPPMLVAYAAYWGIQIAWTNATGIWGLQVSHDPMPVNTSKGDEPVESIWTDLEGYEQTAAGTGDHVWDARTAGFIWVRVTWTPTASGGALYYARRTSKGV